MFQATPSGFLFEILKQAIRVETFSSQVKGQPCMQIVACFRPSSIQLEKKFVSEMISVIIENVAKYLIAQFEADW